MDSFEKIFGRIKEATAIKNMVQFSEIVEASQQNVSWRKKENKFPADWAFKVAQRYGLSTDWIMTGEGPQKPGQGSDDTEIVKQLGRWIQEQESKEPGALAWFSYDIRMKYPEFAKWEKREESYISESDEGSKQNIA